MEVPDQLLCLFNAEIKQRNGSYVIEIPETELSLGALQEGETYRLGMYPSPSLEREAEPEPEQTSEPERRQGRPEPPVEEGDRREVEITDVGDQGDGLGRIDGGFVVIVPDADIGDRVTVEITHVQGNYAVGEMIESLEAGV